MRATARWVLPPDRRALLVVDDPVSIEADPLPNGFVYASEVTGAVVQMDNVWDVAPSPNWTRLAYGRAFMLRGGEQDSIPEAEWRRVEAQLPEDVAERTTQRLREQLKAHTFPASGMTLMLGLGLTQVLWVNELGAGRTVAPTAPAHSLHGWRVRWTRRGDTLAIGAAPRMVDDNAPPSRWVLVRPRKWAIYRDSLGGTTDSSGFARVPWLEGPTMELGMDFSGTRDRMPHHILRVDGGTIEERNGQIVATTRGSDGQSRERVVGPGVPLVATAGGRFVAALVEAPPKPHEMRAQLVVYHIPRR